MDNSCGFVCFLCIEARPALTRFISCLVRMQELARISDSIHVA